MSEYRIGQLAKAAGLSVEAIRYYEQRDLLKPSHRSESGYRFYASDALPRLQFIHRAKELGFSLEEIGELLNLGFDGQGSSAAIKSLVEDKLHLVESRIADLQRLRATLASLSSCCDGSMPTAECPILAFLKEPEPDCCEEGN